MTEAEIIQQIKNDFASLQGKTQADLDRYLALAPYTAKQINAAFPEYGVSDLEREMDRAWYDYVDRSPELTQQQADFLDNVYADRSTRRALLLTGTNGNPWGAYSDPEEAQRLMDAYYAPRGPEVIGGYHTLDGGYVEPPKWTPPAPAPAPTPGGSGGSGGGAGGGLPPSTWTNPLPGGWTNPTIGALSPQWQNRVTVGAAGNEMTGPGNAQYESSLIEALRSSNPQRFSNNAGVAMTPNAPNAPGVTDLDLSIYEGAAFNPQPFELTPATKEQMENWNAYDAYRTGTLGGKSLMSFEQWLARNNRTNTSGDSDDDSDTNTSLGRIIQNIRDTY